jgi:AAA family ATP:ADP antiporter
LGLYTLLYTASSAFVYLEQARVAASTFEASGARTAFFARIDFWVNVVGLAVQVALTGRLMAWLGLGLTAALLPAATLMGSVALAAWPTAACVLLVQVARRSIDYAIARPCREVFYAAVHRHARYRAKGLIDTVLYRAGDVVGAWSYGLLAAVPGLAGATTLALVPLSAAWIALSLLIGRRVGRVGAARVSEAEAAAWLDTGSEAT